MLSGHEKRAEISYALMPLNLETHCAYKTGRDSRRIIEKALRMVHTRKEEIHVGERSLTFLCYTVSLIIPWKPPDSPGTQPPFSSAVVNRSFLGEGGLASLPGVIFSVLDFCPRLIILSP